MAGQNKPDEEEKLGPASPDPTGVSGASPIEPFSPVKPRERVELLDVLRGLAILGILFVNYDVAKLNTPVVFPAALDRFGHNLVYVLGSGKLWPLFAILFGTGFAIQLERAEARGINIIPTYLRRLFFMVVIGGVLGLVINVIQLLLLAKAGVVMLFIGYALRRRPAKWLLVIAIFALTLGPSIGTLRDLRSDPGTPGTPQVSAEEVAARVEEIRAGYKSDAEEALSWKPNRFRQYFSAVSRYYRDYPQSFLRVWTYAHYVGYMLLGMFLWQIGVLKKPADHRRSFLRLFSWSMPLGLVTAIVANHLSQTSYLARMGLSTDPNPVLQLLPINEVASLAMPLTYIAGIALLLQHDLWSRVLRVFAPAGRMALTNYALQRLLPTLVFGLYTPGISQMALGVWLTIAVLALIAGLQLMFSRLWIRSYRFGPLEWLWRSLTYWRFQPMRVKTSEPTA
ncbi:MAG: DUF418 domain-containing protein [Gemmatimonadota bacterium]|jgi:uncharacterized protein